MTTPPTPATAPVRAVRGRQGAVVSPHHLATEAGLAILRSGGSAVDAAIATNAALAVVAGHACGLGGDAFWLIWDAEAGTAHALNGSGRSGAAASIEAVRAAGHGQMPQRGPLSVTVPGAIDSWAHAHERFGRLDWHSLFGPAIELADGFPSGPDWVDVVERAAAIFGVEGDWARVYRPFGRPWRIGELVRLDRLAMTLRRIADDGARTAYTGALGARTAVYFAAAGVPIDAADLDGHASEWAEPIGIEYRGVRSLSHPPNSVGVVALQTLGMLAHFDAPGPPSFDGLGWSDPDWVHIGLEASRLALAERDAHVTDPMWMDRSRVAEMLSQGVIEALVSRIERQRVLPPQPQSLPAGGGTIYLSTADRWGGLVSLLASNYQSFGSGLVDPETGIAFQDRGAFFSLDAGHPNALAPAKRTAHTLAPGMLLRNGQPWIAHGSMGGEIQPQLFAQFVSAIVDGDTDVATAVAVPRWAARPRDGHGPPTVTTVESRMPPSVLAALRQKGHEVVVLEPWSSSMGHGHAIEVLHADDGRVESFAAGADPRSEGQAAAF